MSDLRAAQQLGADDEPTVDSEYGNGGSSIDLCVYLLPLRRAIDSLLGIFGTEVIA